MLAFDRSQESYRRFTFHLWFISGVLSFQFLFFIFFALFIFLSNFLILVDNFATLHHLVKTLYKILLVEHRTGVTSSSHPMAIRNRNQRILRFRGRKRILFNDLIVFLISSFESYSLTKRMTAFQLALVEQFLY